MVIHRASPKSRNLTKFIITKADNLETAIGISELITCQKQ